jgi:hypothetical protein
MTRPPTSEDPPNDAAARPAAGIFRRCLQKIALRLVFYGVLTPIAVVRRMTGRGAPTAPSADAPDYWVRRDDPGTAADSFRRPF